ncbi:hypothetical protein K3495_g5622 [Podosphaera aphanis]|nr:hypothetical protein K3495_g5622 [Podosphaera aphanis]
MRFFTNPTSYRLNSLDGSPSIATPSFSLFARRNFDTQHVRSPMGHLILLVIEAVMEVVFVSLPGYIVARQGMFDAENQKFVANLNVALFTPCLIFTKLASQLTADKLIDLAVIPVIFFVQTTVSYLISIMVAKAFGFGKRPANFVTAMGVFGNSNSLPISLVISLSQTLKGLHWDKIPGDNDDEVAARGILYLLIFQQLGQLVRWSWGYHVLLAPPEKYHEESQRCIEEGNYRDNPDLIPGLDSRQEYHRIDEERRASFTSSFESGDMTPVTKANYTSDTEHEPTKIADNFPKSMNQSSLLGDQVNANITSFPSIRSPVLKDDRKIHSGCKGIIPLIRTHISHFPGYIRSLIRSFILSIFVLLPTQIQVALSSTKNGFKIFLAGTWEFMNPPLWAMLCAVIVASIPKLQHAIFREGTFVANSFTRAVSQSGGVAVPLILVVLGANLARNTLPQNTLDENSEENKIGTKLLVASLLSRMLLPTLCMAPLLAFTAKYIPISILDDPIFVVVCFLLTGAPSALQLAQICQINGVYERVMSKLLFQSYVVWIFPSTLLLVMCALEVVAWVGDS